ncbi:hypothetical protein E0H35_30555 [Rhizobium leguminosarum bv. viciae]|nr:hypothetical protein [Rhizobium leguminosarum bv. viciae]TBY90876.1 hypothetical protein E0H35_30555 [Rhizobium leguminosarum bv. viciae]
MPGTKEAIRRLQMLLHEHCRTPEARAEAIRAVRDVGMTVTGEGSATLSARMPEAEFEELFSEFSGGGETLGVPDKLKPFVSSISVAPKHLSFE